jgi:phosphoribosylanthranilate isomerase
MMVKVCGITNAEDALAAAEAGASALGFNFWPASPRYIAPGQAAEIVAALPADVSAVGVFVNESAARIQEMALQAGVSIVQLHGDCEWPKGLPVWKALPVGEDFDPTALDRFPAAAFLLDSPAGPSYGGTGQAFHWERVRGLRQRIILAGGLDASNVAQAIEAVRPWGVDACSRLESSPGRKNHQRMRAFIQAARSKNS